MDYLETAAALRAIVRTLETVVVPEVHDDFARAQLWASTGVLGNVANDLEAGRTPELAVGDDLQELLSALGLPAGFTDGDAGANASAAVHAAAGLERVIAGHATLHYRRAVAGFSDQR